MNCCPGTVSVGESILRHPVGTAGTRKNAQNGCSFTHIFKIRLDYPPIAVFRGKSGFPETLIYAFMRQISLGIGRGYLKIKRKPVLGDRPLPDTPRHSVLFA